ncbi:MAG: AAA family ATPase, partial [Pseudomonadota bacterium]
MTPDADQLPETLAPDALRRGCSIPEAPRADTEAGQKEESLGQDRAVEAIQLASDIRRSGYNLFVMGPFGAAARRLVGQMLHRRAADMPRPSDWVYVNNFEEPNKPRALQMPAGRATELRDSMDQLVEDLRASLPAVFESEDFRSRREKIDDDFQSRQNEAFEELAEKAQERGVAILRTPMGFAVAPVKDGKVIGPDKFNELPEEEQEETQKIISEIQEELQQLMREAPKLEKERRESVRALERETAEMAVGQSLEEIRQRFSDLPSVVEHLEQVRRNLIDKAALFLIAAQEQKQGQNGPAREDERFAAFKANPVVAQDDGEPGAPVVFEDHPTLMNLIGRIEYLAHQGALVTNFTLIKPGALHRANGGFLLLDARQILSEPFAWSGLKRALRAGAIRIEPPAEYIGFATTFSLEPDPIPLDLKVAVFGERIHYYLLLQLDPEMRDLFKIVADFEDDAERSGEVERALADALAAVAVREELRPLSRGAAEAMVDHAARLSDDAARLSLDLERLTDRLREADHFAGEAGRGEIGREDVERAVEAELRRTGRIRERAQEMILRDLARIETDGEAVGQVNGLSVSQIGDHRFGRPTRITA